MKECAWCGRENDDDAVRCGECGTSEFKGERTTATPPKDADEPEAEPIYQDIEPDISPEGENVLCTSCLFPNPPARTFCKRCGGPIGIISTIGPYETCLAEGFMYRRVVQGRPKLIVLVGIWLIFLPTFLVGLMAISMVLIDGGFERVIFFVGGICAIAISSMILFKVTKNYFTIPPKRID